MGGSGPTVPGIVRNREKCGRALASEAPDQVGKEQLITDRHPDQNTFICATREAGSSGSAAAHPE